MKQIWWTIRDKAGRIVPGILFQNTGVIWGELKRRKRSRKAASAKHWLPRGYKVVPIEIEVEEK